MSVLKLIIYIIYRIIRDVMSYIQSYWFQFPKNSPTIQCEILTILYRLKSVEGDIAKEWDFLWLHDKFYDAEKLLKYNPNWVLYTISDRYAYFTLLPKPISEYNVKHAPFIFLEQFADARQLVRMPIKDFCTFACHSLAPMKGKVVFFTNCPRSGSTLITQMVQVGQKVVTIAEPMTFTNLVMMYDENILSPDLFNAMLRSLFYAHCKDMTEDQIYILKMPSEGAALVGHIYKLLPEVIHIFQFRENVEKALISSYKMMHEFGYSEETFYFMANFPTLARWLFGYQNEKRTVDKVKPQSALETTMVIFGAPYTFFLKNRHCYALPEVTYENLISKPEETLGAVFDVCGISKSLIPEGLTALNRDSQAGTLVSKDKMAQVKSLELTSLNRRKLNELVKRMELPEDVFHF